MFTKNPDILSFEYGIYDYDQYIENKTKQDQIKKEIEDIKKQTTKYTERSKDSLAGYKLIYGNIAGEILWNKNSEKFYEEQNKKIKEKEEELKKVKLEANYKILDFDIYEFVDMSKKANAVSYPVEIMEQKTGAARKSYIYDYKYVEKGRIQVKAYKELNSFMDNIKNISNLEFNGNLKDLKNLKIGNNQYNEFESSGLDVTRYVNLIKNQLAKYLAEKHRISINTETNIYKYYDLISYRIVNNEKAQGTLSVVMEFLQNINIKDNQLDIVELGNVETVKTGNKD